MLTQHHPPLPAMIDAHVHLWDPARLRYPWLDDLPQLNAPHDIRAYRQAANGAPVRGIVFVQCEALAEQNLAEAEWITAIAADDPLICGVVAYCALEQGSGARDDLQRLARLPLVKGIRRHLQFEPDPEFCLRPEFIAGVRLLADFGFTFDLLLTHIHLKPVLKLVRACPQVEFVIDHVGKPAVRDGQLWPWGEDLAALAAEPNIVCKLSGLITEADHANWQPEQLAPFILQAVKVFGFERLLFGSDWPVVNLAGSFHRWLQALRQGSAGATAGDFENLFHRNAMRIYRLEKHHEITG